MNVSDSAEFSNFLLDMELFVDLQRVVLAFDRGYWKVERFIDLSMDGIRFITPLKKGVNYRVLTRRKGREEGRRERSGMIWS